MKRRRRTVIYKTDGTKVARDWEAGTRPDLAWLQRAVGGGLIELCPGARDGKQIYADEEGFLKRLPTNRQIRLPSQPLVGDVVVCYGFPMDEGDDRHLCPDPGEVVTDDDDDVGGDDLERSAEHDLEQYSAPVDETSDDD